LGGTREGKGQGEGGDSVANSGVCRMQINVLYHVLVL